MHLYMPIAPLCPSVSWSQVSVPSEYTKICTCCFQSPSGPRRGLLLWALICPLSLLNSHSGLYRFVSHVGHPFNSPVFYCLSAWMCDKPLVTARVWMHSNFSTLIFVYFFHHGKENSMQLRSLSRLILTFFHQRFSSVGYNEIAFQTECCPSILENHLQSKQLVVSWELS